MTGNSDGLSPSLKPFLGIGHNRALPASFGFDNGIKPDGSNDYLIVPKMNGQVISGNISIECWIDFLGSITTFGLLRCLSIDNQYFVTINYSGGANASIIPPMVGLGSGSDFPVSALNATGKNHIVVNFYNNRTILYINGGVNNGGYTLQSPPYGTYTFTISSMRPLSRQSVDSINSYKFDEYRIYNRVLSEQEVSLNYNGGVGNNPCVTENLLIWYDFQKFENLDFSVLQDGSDYRLGLRDHSGKNNHAQPINMDTNPASPNYVLKPF